MSVPLSANHPITVVVGTRPEVIKLAPVVEALGNQGTPTILLATGQHREMLDPILESFDLVPDRNLAVMSRGQSLADLSARLMETTDSFLDRVEPARVVVQGDTTTVVMMALTAFYRRIPVAHVEAGLRTGRRFDPFPEEMNRTLLAHLADLHFAPTPRARKNLLDQGVDIKSIHLVGNTIVDALRSMIHRVNGKSFTDLGLPDPGDRRLIVVTVHRRESFGRGLRQVFTGLRRLAESFGDRILMIYPVHLNPNVHPVAHEMLSDLANVHLTNPLTYPAFVKLLTAAELIVTDSGGVQEEAAVLGVPALVTRDTTERQEVLETGVAELVGTDPERLLSEARRLLTEPGHYASRARPSTVFGDGSSGKRIARLLVAEDGMAEAE